MTSSHIQLKYLLRTCFAEIIPGPSLLRRIVCDNVNPGGKNYILDHPKIMERYRHITEIPGTEDPESGGVLLHRELDGREGVLGPALCGGLDGLRSIINPAFPRSGVV